MPDRNLARVAGIAAIAAIVALVATLGIDVPIRMGRGPGMHQPVETVVQVKVFLATFNGVLLLALGWNYLTLYRDLPNPFTRSLLVVTAALFLYALASNPVVHIGFGYRGASLGPFTFLPDLFAGVAVLLLLYQSYQ